MLNVECTEREPDLNNHLSKLTTRTKLLKTTYAVPVYPVLVTKFPRDVLNTTDQEKATKESISILTADDFGTLIQMAIEGASPTRVCEYILGLKTGFENSNT